MRLFILSALSFFVIVSSGMLAANARAFEKVETLKVQETPQVVKTRIEPVLLGGETFPVLSAQSVYAVDVATGTPLYEKNPDGRLFPASTTKIITAMVAWDYFPLDQVLTVRNVNIEGQKMNLLPGEKIKARDLLYGLLVFSANDAGEVLAQNYSGGRTAFVDAMNLKAKELGLTESYFKNPTGLDEDGHMTTARDLTVAAKAIMMNDFLRTVVATKEKEVRSVDGMIVHPLTNVNKLLGEVEGVLGVKTGWTENARENLVTYYQKDGKTISLVILGSQDRFGETKELIDWIFKNYAWQAKVVSN